MKILFAKIRLVRVLLISCVAMLLAGQSFALDVGESQMFTPDLLWLKHAKRQNSTVTVTEGKTSEKDFYFIFGPYIELDEGEYDLEVELSTKLAAEQITQLGFAEVYSHQLKYAIQSIDTPQSDGKSYHFQTLRLKFYVPKKEDNFEFRFWWNGKGSIKFEKMKLSRRSEKISYAHLSSMDRAGSFLDQIPEKPYTLLGKGPLGTGVLGVVFEIERKRDKKRFVLKLPNLGTLHLRFDSQRRSIKSEKFEISRKVKWVFGSGRRKIFVYQCNFL